MTTLRCRVLRFLATLVAVSVFAMALNTMHQAGCAGDLKGGTVGDLSRALQLEQQGMAWGFAGVALVSWGAASFAGRSTARRVGTAVAAGALAYALLVGAMFHVETEAVRWCIGLAAQAAKA